MPTRFKNKVSFQGDILKAALRRVKDNAHFSLSEKDAHLLANAYLEGAGSFQPNIPRKGTQLSSLDELAYLKDGKYFIGLINSLSNRMFELVRRDAKDAFSTIFQMQREIIILDTEVEEKEIELLGNYSKVHLNTFVRQKDGNLQYTDKSWIKDFKTEYSFLERYLMRVLPGAGLTLPVKDIVKMPIIDAVLLDERTDVGDSLIPVVSSSPRNVFLKNKTFKHVVIRKEFDNSSRVYKKNTSFDEYPYNCTSTCTIQLEMPNNVMLNYFNLVPLGDSTISVKQLSYINESGEEIALNTITIPTHTETTFLFAPIHTRYLIITFEQYATVGRTTMEVGDARAAHLNDMIKSAGWTYRLEEPSWEISGRAYDFSIKDIEVGFVAYENKGVFRSLPVKVNSPIGLDVTKTVEAIVMVESFGTYNELITLPEGRALQEAYVGIRLWDRDGNLRVDDLCPVKDENLYQLEYLSPIGDTARVKLYPDFRWTLDKACITETAISSLCIDPVTGNAYEWADGEIEILSQMISQDAVGDIDRGSLDNTDVEVITLDGGERTDFFKPPPQWNPDLAIDIDHLNAKGDEHQFSESELDFTNYVDGLWSGLFVKVFGGTSLDTLGDIPDAPAGANPTYEFKISDQFVKDYFNLVEHKEVKTENIPSIIRVLKRDPLRWLGIDVQNPYMDRNFFRGTITDGVEIKRATYLPVRPGLYRNNKGISKNGTNLIKANIIRSARVGAEKENYTIEFSMVKKGLNYESLKRRFGSRAARQLTNKSQINQAGSDLKTPLDSLRKLDLSVAPSEKELKKIMSAYENFRLKTSEITNTILLTQYGYMYNKDTRAVERVIDSENRYWRTPFEARASKGALPEAGRGGIQYGEERLRGRPNITRVNLSYTGRGSKTDTTKIRKMRKNGKRISIQDKKSFLKEKRSWGVKQARDIKRRLDNLPVDFPSDCPTCNTYGDLSDEELSWIAATMCWPAMFGTLLSMKGVVNDLVVAGGVSQDAVDSLGWLVGQPGYDGTDKEYEYDIS